MKNKILLLLLVMLILVGGFYIYKIANKKVSVQMGEEKQTLQLVNDLAPVNSQGVSVSLGQDAEAENLQSVRTSDDALAIETDLNETNLSGLDSELDSIKSDLLGL